MHFKLFMAALILTVSTLAIAADATTAWTGPIGKISASAIVTPRGEVFQITSKTKFCDENGKTLTVKEFKEGTESSIVLKVLSKDQYEALAVQLGMSLAMTHELKGGQLVVVSVVCGDKY